MYLPTSCQAMADVYYLYWRENDLTAIPPEWNAGWARSCTEH